ncbi:MAG: cytochrome c maturation protein CcmE [Gemmatimonadetes bacterium]|nr:cytochrome c maturation protein CcmE [Gemmatimonadota bacterium]
MKKRARFLIGVAVVAVAVGYLMWTGARETMVYYLTPGELMAKVSTDPTFRDMGVKVGARVVPGSLVADTKNLHYRFEVMDIETGTTRFPVSYEGALPDTFTENGDVVVEGRIREDGVFVAMSVLTKCGSRYEAAPEEFAR